MHRRCVQYYLKKNFRGIIVCFSFISEKFSGRNVGYCITFMAIRETAEFVFIVILNAIHMPCVVHSSEIFVFVVAVCTYPG